MSIKRKSALSALCVAVTLTPRVPRAISTSHEDISFPCTISCRGVRMPTHHESGSARMIRYPAASTAVSAVGLLHDMMPIIVMMLAKNILVFIIVWCLVAV